MPFIPTKSDACTSTSWPRATFFRLSHARAKSEFLTLSNWDQPAKGDNPGRKHWSSRIVGGWAWGWQPHTGKKKCHEIGRSKSRPDYPTTEECGDGWRRLAEAPEEGQGPHRAVEPMMMMMMIADTAVWIICRMAVSVGVLATFYIYIWEALGSNLGRDTSHPDWGFWWPSIIPRRKCLVSN
jgi:hypothetical protein